MSNCLIRKLEELSSFLIINKIWFKNNYKIKYETYFKTGGSVKVYICPQECRELIEIVRCLKELELEYKIIGFTSNLLLLDQVEYTVLISTRNMTSIEIGESTIDVACGYSLQDFVRVAVMYGASGFEGLEGIPGSIGGAIFMNAGAYDYDISDYLISVECINPKGEFEVLSKQQCEFGYRQSRFKYEGSFVILSAKFKLQLGDRGQIERNIEKYHIARHSYQEFVYPNLGSMFSVHSNIYAEVFRKSLYYNFIYLVLKVLLKNPISKFIARKRPNNKILNALLLRRIKRPRFQPSAKSINILINDGKTPIDDMIAYIFRIRGYLNDNISLENEIVLEPVFSIKEEFKPTYLFIKSKL